MKIKEFIQSLETIAPAELQEDYDNSGLLTGNPDWECTGVICTLDTLEPVVEEAIEKRANLIVSHHPILFKGLKNLTGKNYVERTLIKAIKNDIALYAIHTNLDNVLAGVNGRIADKLNLINQKVLLPKTGNLVKLFTFVPLSHLEKISTAMFEAGAGHIGKYSECSFNAKGTGTFKPMKGTTPYLGKIGERHREPEMKVEVIFPGYLQKKVVAALLAAHPYEEVAYDLVPLLNEALQEGSGIIGELEKPLPTVEFLEKLKAAFLLRQIRHTVLLKKEIKKVAVCGGAGSFLIAKAIAENADIFISADIKYHEFFDADQKIIIADIGHGESEHFTIDLLYDILKTKFPTFAIQKTSVNTNPVSYF